MTRFQTPSERGGIVLGGGTAAPAIPSRSFKPLQNGAVLCWFFAITAIAFIV